jgi:uncharacterized protein (TIGR03437 family)
VRIGGQSAPLLAVWSGQVNTIVPYGLHLGTHALLEVLRGGEVVFQADLSVTFSRPTPLLRFDLDLRDGLPLADAVNEDGTPNSAENPAPAGSLVTIFATGYGQLAPAAIDGAPGSSTALRPTAGPLLVNTSLGGIEADVTTVIDRTNSVVQIQLRLPADAGDGRLRFSLGPPFTDQTRVPTNFIYVAR